MKNHALMIICPGFRGGAHHAAAELSWLLDCGTDLTGLPGRSANERPDGGWRLEHDG